ncbi:sulfurtransferase TusA family protein [Paracoccus aerodenitrificans]|uniref:sulfurtransferase TusA family protein n=1 Tax=Paracoccus aerodenitrificans TaxID=3017781 RepID=UPI0022F0A94B|nr:sulfurtransferase TusA family protein [Paracoccus aerodenitrificans]WBU63999.1 sulfurtransferase TusA family protein [Paracoccus aerodenitrificans]
MTEIDARGLLCPLPVLRLRKTLMSRRKGDIVLLIATDRMAAVDVPHFCTGAGHRLLSVTEGENGEYRFQVECGTQPV